MGRLDPPGLAYARLIADPCNAVMAHPTYSGSSGGYLIRADSLTLVGVGATETSGFINWTPAALTATTHGLVGAGSTGWGTNATAAYQAGNPGYTFLASNAGVARCVAACMRVFYPGAESTRAGYLAYGQLSGGAIVQGTLQTPQGVAQMLNTTQRMPANDVELFWRPNDSDQAFQNLQPTGTYDDASYEKASLCVAWGGIPVSTGLGLHLTAVYEWQPGQGLGIASASSNYTASRNTLSEVVNALKEAGFEFVRSAGTAAANNLSVLAAMGSFGLMGSRAYSRPLQQLV